MTGISNDRIIPLLHLRLRYRQTLLRRSSTDWNGLVMFPSCFVYYHVRPSTFNMTACTLEICIERKDFITILFSLKNVLRSLWKDLWTVYSNCLHLPEGMGFNESCRLWHYSPYYIFLYHDVRRILFLALMKYVRIDTFKLIIFVFHLASAKTSSFLFQNQNNELKKAKKELKSAGLGYNSLRSHCFERQLIKHRMLESKYWLVQV